MSLPTLPNLLNPKQQALKRQVDTYINEKKYNLPVVDVMPFIIANALHTNIELVNRVNGNYSIFLVYPHSPTDNLVSILRRGDHFDALITSPPIECSDAPHMSPAYPDAPRVDPEIMEPNAADESSVLVQDDSTLLGSFMNKAVSIVKYMMGSASSSHDQETSRSQDAFSDTIISGMFYEENFSEEGNRLLEN